MNDHGAHDLEESRTRRSLLATAGGLLLPAGLLIAKADDAEATTKAKRRRRRRHGGVGAFANDVIINVRNATNETLMTRYPRGRDVFVPTGTESGFAAGLATERLGLDAHLFIKRAGDDRFSYRIWCENHEIGTPDARIYWYDRSDPHDLTGNRDMDENETFEITHRGYRFAVHRWSNGKEPLDGYDEWYTRFFVTMSEA